MFKPLMRLGWPDARQAKIENSTCETIEKLLNSLKQESVQEADERREKQKWENYIPASEKRPLDEFFDLNSIKNECVEGPIDITADKDGGLLKYVMKQSTSIFPRNCESADSVYYTHETRFDNGQLVDFDEKRKAKEKFEMSDPRQHEHIRLAFQTMRKGEIVWLKIGPKYHGNIYHNYCKKDHLKPDVVLG